MFVWGGRGNDLTQRERDRRRWVEGSGGGVGWHSKDEINVPIALGAFRDKKGGVGRDIKSYIRSWIRDCEIITST